MTDSYENIINLLNGLTADQKSRLLLCLKRDESIAICLGLVESRIMERLASIDDITSGRAGEICCFLKENKKFARIVRSNIERITEPYDNINDFMDFRMENWPEE